MKYCSNWVSSLWIYSHFEQYFMPGQIRPVEFNRACNTAQIGLKFMDLLPVQLGMKYCSNWVSSLWIYSQIEQYFMPGRIPPAGRIRPGMKYCSNWVEIHGFTPNSISQAYKCNLSEFTPI